MAEENKAVEDLNINKGIADQNSLTIENEDKDESSNQDISDDYKEIIEMKEEFVKSKKKSILSKILIGLIAFLILLLAIGITLYFLGFFDPKEEPVQTVTQENPLPVENKEESYKFDIKDINSKKLNEQLSYLTNKNINQDKTEELEKIENEKRIIEEEKKREEEAYKAQEEALLKEKAAIEEKKIELENEKAQLEAMKQEAIMLRQELEASKTKLEVVEPIAKEEVVIAAEIATPEVKQETTENTVPAKNETSNNSFLKLINVAKIKGSLYKKYLDKITDINPNAVLCRDDKNRIEIYFGPFNNDEIRAELLDKLVNNGFEEAFEIELTQEEFDKRCNY